MTEFTRGNLYGLNIKTNINLPTDFPFNSKLSFGDEKSVIFHTDHPISMSISGYDNFRVYSKNDRNNILYKRNDELNTYIIDTDRIGTAMIDRKRISYTPSPIQDSDPKSNAFLLSFGLGIAMLLRLNDYVVLHASALQIENRTILIMGQSGVGKTTLCSYLIKNCSSILVSDDMSCIDTNTSKLFAGFPLMRLWPQTVENILGQNVSKLDKVGRNGKLYFPVSNSTKSLIHNIDAVIILQQTTDATPSFQRLETKNLIFNLFKHIYNRPSLDAVALNKEMAGICNIISNNKTEGFIFYNPRTYESLVQLSTILIDCIK